MSIQPYDCRITLLALIKAATTVFDIISITETKTDELRLLILNHEKTRLNGSPVYDSIGTYYAKTSVLVTANEKLVKSIQDLLLGIQTT